MLGCTNWGAIWVKKCRQMSLSTQYTSGLIDDRSWKDPQKKLSTFIDDEIHDSRLKIHLMKTFLVLFDEVNFSITQKKDVLRQARASSSLTIYLLGMNQKFSWYSESIHWTSADKAMVAIVAYACVSQIFERKLSLEKEARAKSWITMNIKHTK